MSPVTSPGPSTRWGGACLEWCGRASQSTGSSGQAQGRGCFIPSSPNSGPSSGQRLLSQWGAMTFSGVSHLPRFSPSDSGAGSLYQAWSLGYIPFGVHQHTTSWQLSPPPTTRCLRQPHHVHDGQHVALDIRLPVVLHHFGVGYHQGLHPLLFADRAPESMPQPLPPLFPTLPPGLQLWKLCGPRRGGG